MLHAYILGIAFLTGLRSTNKGPLDAILSCSFQFQSRLSFAHSDKAEPSTQFSGFIKNFRLGRHEQWQEFRQIHILNDKETMRSHRRREH